MLGEDREHFCCCGFFFCLFVHFLMRKPLLRDQNSTSCSRQNNTPDIIGWWAHAQHGRQQLSVVGLKINSLSRAPKATDSDCLLKPNSKQEELFTSLPFNCPFLLSAGFSFSFRCRKDKLGVGSLVANWKWLWKQAIGSHDRRINKCQSQNERKE